MEYSTHVSLKSYLDDLDADIPMNDIDAWVRFPDHRQVYNKIWLAETQGIPCGPMGIFPKEYPVIFKPIINLYGMSRGIKVIYSDSEYDANIRDGMFWSKFLVGTYRCIDLIIKNGRIVFSSSLISYSSSNLDGSFDYHESDPNYEITADIREWIEVFLDDYVGCVNLETINDKIIEIHLRLNGDSHLYDKDFANELILFFKGKRDHVDIKIKKKYLIPLFVEKHINPENIDPKRILEICNSFQIMTVEFDDIDSKYQSEYRSRLLMLESFDLNFGMKCREKIMEELV